MKACGYAALSAGAALVPFSFNRRKPRPDDVVIDILYCGICHSDIHQVRNEWTRGNYPMVPGHEIIGRVLRVGAQVSRIKQGALVGVGVMVDSCRQCAQCHIGQEQYCEEGCIPTYNGYEYNSQTLTYGGYSDLIVVDQSFVLDIKHTTQLAAVAPLLCAGITSYSPLRHWQIGPGKQVGIIGLGGLGHMAIKLARAMGAEVTLFSRSPQKAKDAIRLGAHHTVLSGKPDAFTPMKNSMDLILNTVSAQIDLAPYLDCLRHTGTLVMLGIADQPLALPTRALISGRKAIAGSFIGGIRETQAMLDFCAEHAIVSDIETIAINDVNDAYDRVVNSDVKYRFVIDMTSLKQARAY